MENSQIIIQQLESIQQSLKENAVLTQKVLEDISSLKQWKVTTDKNLDIIRDSVSYHDKRLSNVERIYHFEDSLQVLTAKTNSMDKEIDKRLIDLDKRISSSERTNSKLVAYAVFAGLCAGVITQIVGLIIKI